MKLMEVEGGLDNRALVLAVGLQGLKRLSRLSPEHKGHPILSWLPGPGFRLLSWGHRAIFPVLFPLARSSLITCFFGYRITHLSYSQV